MVDRHHRQDEQRLNWLSNHRAPTQTGSLLRLARNTRTTLTITASTVDENPHAPAAQYTQSSPGSNANQERLR